MARPAPVSGPADLPTGPRWQRRGSFHFGGCPSANILEGGPVPYPRTHKSVQYAAYRISSPSSRRRSASASISSCDGGLSCSLIAYQQSQFGLWHVAPGILRTRQFLEYGSGLRDGFGFGAVCSRARTILRAEPMSCSSSFRITPIILSAARSRSISALAFARSCLNPAISISLS